VHVDVQAAEVTLPSKLASALALAANELIVNAVRHGGHKRSDIALRIELQCLPGQLRLTVTDDGKGFPPGFNLRSQAKIGLNLTLTLIERDFGGKLTYANNAQGGATVTATVPYQE
jgi:two-component system, sensor histidine kinase PdtaS